MGGQSVRHCYRIRGDWNACLVSGVSIRVGEQIIFSLLFGTLGVDTFHFCSCFLSRLSWPYESPRKNHRL